MHRIAIVLGGVLIPALAGAALGGVETTRFGERVANFRLRTADGRDISLDEFQGKRAVVLFSMGTECPLGNLYLPRLSELARDYQDRGVVVLGINSNAGLEVEAVAAHAREFGATFPVLLDPDGSVADRIGVERTCTAVVVDGQGRLRYRGAIDDQYAYTTRRSGPTRAFLTEAVDAILDGRAVAVESTEVQGCPIQRAAQSETQASETSAPTPPPAAEVTYSRDVAPILQARCQSCHRPGQIGPFALESFDDATRWAASIAEAVDDGRMPPWHADPRFGHFANDRSFAPGERETLLAWIDQGMPEGDPAALPEPRTYPEDWGIGEPDAVFSLPEPVTVKAEGVMKYLWYRVPTGFAEDKWVRGIELRPTNRAVVHHILVFVDEGDGGPMPDAIRGNQLTGYVPGDEPTIYPDGMAKKIPAGADLLFQVHYTPVGRETTDQSAIALVFADGPQEHEVHTRGIATQGLRIPPREANYRAPTAVMTLPIETTLLSMWPHMHLRGKDFQFKAIYPDGREEILLSVPRYDFNWQTCYALAEPKSLPAGTRLECLAHFDNSAGNPNNPDPDALVRFGPQTSDEMLIGYIDVVASDAGLALPATAGRDLLGPGPAAEHAAEAFERFDEDGDGQIRPSELTNSRIFARFDIDKNNIVTRDEVVRGFEILGRLQGRGLGRGRAGGNRRRGRPEPETRTQSQVLQNESTSSSAFSLA